MQHGQAKPHECTCGDLAISELSIGSGGFTNQHSRRYARTQNSSFSIFGHACCRFSTRDWPLFYENAHIWMQATHLLILFQIMRVRVAKNGHKILGVQVAYSRLGWVTCAASRWWITQRVRMHVSLDSPHNASLAYLQWCPDIAPWLFKADSATSTRVGYQTVQ